jgi:uncharacterized protein (DUF2062 family)
MPRKYLRKVLPSHSAILSRRELRWLSPWLGHHNLWHVNRHSVAGGVAVGAFAGLIPGPFQMLGAALISSVLRVNLPVAVFTTLYTNPITIVPLYIAAFKLGQFATRSQTSALPSFDFDWQSSNWLAAIPAFWHWFAALGTPLLVGLILLASLLSAVSYFAVQGLWRWHVLRQWRKRQQRRTG